MANSVIIRRVLRNILAFLVAALVLCQFLQAPLSFLQSNSVVINEIMYDPVPQGECTEGKSEWVEVFSSQSGYQLDGWELSDLNSRDSLAGAVIPPSGYLILVANRDCFKLMHPEVPDTSIFDVPSEALGNGLSNDGDAVILFESNTERDRKDYGKGAISAEGLSLALTSEGSWKEADPTPGAENSFPEEETKNQQEEQPQPTINFSSPSTVSVGVPFSVTVTLKNFKAGTYALKVFIGKGGKFIYGNTKGPGGWLTQSGKWAEMPQITINSSGSKTIQAKTDDDTAAGNYLITVSVAKKRGDGSFESLWKIADLPTKSLAVTGSVEPGGTSRASDGEELSSSSAEEILGEVTGGDGEVKGEEAPQGEGFKLNFYTILGIFGMLVGSGGLTLAFRRGVRRSRTLDTPESGPATPS